MMFEFLFHGTPQQYDFFTGSVKKRLKIDVQCEPPNDENDRVCKIPEETDNIFLVGMILASCYAAYNN